ncbi:unnamed protein product [Choristocarpus tenellus]
MIFILIRSSPPCSPCSCSTLHRPPSYVSSWFVLSGDSLHYPCLSTTSPHNHTIYNILTISTHLFFLHTCCFLLIFRGDKDSFDGHLPLGERGWRVKVALMHKEAQSEVLDKN